MVIIILKLYNEMKSVNLNSGYIEALFRILNEVYKSIK